jgi:glycosyltransferase involved in cell wall biosynthesis
VTTGDIVHAARPFAKTSTDTLEFPDTQRAVARKRCAIVECYPRHDEVYLTTVHLLQQLGHEVHVFNVWRNRIRNSFVHAPGLKPRVHSRLTAAQVLDAVRRQRFDLVVFNTFEGQAVLDCARDVLEHTPVLGFMHNGSFICNLPQYRPFVSDPRCRLMVLAPYVAGHFAQVAAAGTMVPVFFFDRDIPPLPRRHGRRRFCVQGYFDPKRRHYPLLLAALKSLRGERRADFEVYVMGRSFDPQFREFARQVRAAGLQDHVRYTWKGIGYRSYYRLLNSSDFLLPLISPESHPTYFRSKSTSSIAAAVGFNAVPIAHEQLARFYSLEDIAFTYTSSLLDAMRSALDTSDEKLAVLRSRLAELRLRTLGDSRRQLAQAIDSVSAA